MKRTPSERLLDKHTELVHSEMQQVISHVQRQNGEWFLNTVMLEGYDVPFKYKRKKQYRSLKGARVNLTYYPDAATVAGIPVEVMRVVRIVRS